MENESSKTLKIDKDVYLKAFENSGIYAKFDRYFNIIYTNRQFCQIMHTTRQKALNVKLSSFMRGDLGEIIEVIKCKQSWEGVQIFTAFDNEEVHLRCSFIPIYDKKESLFEVLFLASDITELALSKASKQKEIYQDRITGLANRLRLFTDKSIVPKDTKSTYIIFNIDSFDSINGLYGESFGDQILAKVARWLEKNLLSIKTKLYKLEADIYVTVCFVPIEEKKLREYLISISKKIQNEKFVCNDTQIDISMTIGAAQGQLSQLNLSQIAYKEAKQSKRSFVIYDKASNKEEEYKKNIKISKTIKNAVENNLVFPYFQAIMNLSTGRIEKYEALMRIKDEKGVILSPFEFLGIAKRSKIYPMLSHSLIEKSIEVFKNCPYEFSINLSFLDIVNPVTTKFIIGILEKSGMGPWIIFEILESEGIENYKEVMKFTEEVKAYGAKIAIDDFGSGYSNFERLIELQVDFIKIDGSLIKNIDQNDDMQIITRNIANFARELKIKTIAEFVHSQSVFNQVKSLNIDFAQGYFIGKPSPKLT